MIWNDRAHSRPPTIFRRNAGRHSYENLSVEPVDLDEELFAVARDLCAVAAVLFARGSAEKAAHQLEQAWQLLEERARIVARREARRPAELQ